MSAQAATRLGDVPAPWREKYLAVEAGWEVVHAQPARVLAGESARADLVVLGRQRDGSAVGSVTHAVLSHAHGPVVTVPGRLSSMIGAFAGRTGALGPGVRRRNVVRSRYERKQRNPAGHDNPTKRS